MLSSCAPLVSLVHHHQNILILFCQVPDRTHGSIRKGQPPLRMQGHSVINPEPPNGLEESRAGVVSYKRSEGNVVMKEGKDTRLNA
jgi:hypothetical protein